ncbi:hypothetical protein [Candidatus Solincola sp.]|nr:hypothetical protein [Actinomycetota bacterium]
MVSALGLALVFVLLPGCGGGGDVEKEEAELADFAVREILVPREGDRNFVALWTRKSEGTGDVSVEALAQRIWKWEGGALSEIDLEEYHRLLDTHQGERNTWSYAEHSVTVLEYNPEKGEAVVEIGSLYGPMTGAGIRYFLRREDGKWKKVSEQTVWISRAGRAEECVV